MQRLAAIVTVAAIAVAAFIPEHSVLRGVVRETRILVQDLAKDSSKQVEKLGNELEDAMQDLEDACREAFD